MIASKPISAANFRTHLIRLSVVTADEHHRTGRHRHIRKTRLIKTLYELCIERPRQVLLHRGRKPGRKAEPSGVIPSGFVASITIFPASPPHASMTPFAAPYGTASNTASASAAASATAIAGPARSASAYSSGRGTPKVIVCPISANRRPSVAPTFPAPMTAIFIFILPVPELSAGPPHRPKSSAVR